MTPWYVKYIYFSLSNQVHIDFFLGLPHNKRMDTDVTTQAIGPGAGPDRGPEETTKKKRNTVLILLLALALCAMAAGAYALIHLSGLKQARQAADELMAQGDYARALDAYARLMEDDPLSFTSLADAFPSAGADGVLACADALLETAEGAHYLKDNGVLPEVLARADHPAVPAAFKPSLERRSLLCEAVLAEEAGDLSRALALLNEADLRQELSRSVEQQIILGDALRAREEGRYEDAIGILTEAGLAPELAAEIRQQMVGEEDARIVEGARATLANMDLAGALQALQGLSREEDRLAFEAEFAKTWDEALASLHEQYKNRLWAGAWYTLALGDTPLLTGDRRYADLDLSPLQEGTVTGGMFSFIQVNGGRVRLLGDNLGSQKIVDTITDAKAAALGMNHGLILHADGTVTDLGARQHGRKAVADWTDIVQVAAGGFHSLGLKADGTVVAAGLDRDGQCEVTGWTDVVSVAAGLRHSVALLSDGHVAAVGDNSLGQCDVGDWENVIDVRCGGTFTLGLTADYRLLAAGDNSCGQCDVEDWPQVVAFDGGLWHTVALLADGKLVTAGANGHAQDALDGTALFGSHGDVQRTAAETIAETEYVYVADPLSGPWIYYSGDGCVIAAYDSDASKIAPTRADLICTWGHPPVGILSGGGNRPKGPVYPAQLAKQNRSVFAITGDYFTFSYNADGLQIRCGTVFKEATNEKGFSFYPDGSMRIVDPHATTAEDLLQQGIQDSWVFGPVLIENGEAVDITGHPLSFNDVTMRTVFASLCPYHHVAAAYSTSTLAQVTADLLDYGCDIAYNLDGGRSCMMLFMGKFINKSWYIYEGGWRALQDMVGYLTSELVPKP